MAASTRWVLCLCLGWGCLCLALGDVLKGRRVGLRRRAAPGGVRGGRARAAAGDYSLGQRQEDRRRPPERLQPGDKVSEHMLRLYDQYSGGRGGRAAAPRPHDPPGLPAPYPWQGNTVRGFRPLAAGECRGARVGGGGGMAAGEEGLAAGPRPVGEPRGAARWAVADGGAAAARGGGRALGGETSAAVRAKRGAGAAGLRVMLCRQASRLPWFRGNGGNGPFVPLRRHTAGPARQPSHRAGWLV